MNTAVQASEQTIPTNKKVHPEHIVTFVVTLVIAVIFLIPVFFALISAFKTNGEIIANPVALPTSLNLDNFVQLFKKADVWGALRNTLILTVVSELLIVVVVPMGAYGIQRTGNKWLKKCYAFFMVGMMIPFHVYMFSLFREMQAFGIYKTMIGPIVCYISGSVPFGTLMYFNFLKGIPVEIEEAATIDGCSPMRTFWQVVFPLLGPCTASMVVLNGLGIWNDFLMPYLVLPSNQTKTLTVEIFKFVDQFSTQWNIVFAGTIFAIIPALIMFFSLQKYFVKGITSGAAKG